MYEYEFNFRSCMHQGFGMLDQGSKLNGYSGNQILRPLEAEFEKSQNCKVIEKGKSQGLAWTVFENKAFKTFVFTKTRDQVMIGKYGRKIFKGSNKQFKDRIEF